MKRTKVFYNVLILLAALLLTACHDQKDIPVVSSPEKSLVLSEHISNQKVKSICEDKYGQIWIGTFRGLNKYDATSITNTTAWTIHWDCPTTILPTFTVTPTTDSG